ncbi:related to VPS8 - vacuolar sorting protein, 134 kD [Cephalotrichum gorgonifer]|uniref:Related to VPS8 - vacuolar sorting protein, 134 kD n=1 Tax=Cephalotrichum gorgonifer TaxID=2041049 RepID=A0AAE8SV44_9PEZI|nr:related to VPS8 - vacuolar sorting protein, 134 kD [Cephalotrichum gorgonifer]
MPSSAGSSNDGAAPPASGNGAAVDGLEDEGQATPVRTDNGAIPNRYRELLREQRDEHSEDGSSVDNAPRGAGSFLGSMLSVPDDSASLQGSGFSSPGSSVLPSIASRTGLNSPTPSLRPFDRRFQSRISPFSQSPGSVSRPSSPAFMNSHSRNVSLSSQLLLDPAEADTSSPPWEVVRWTKLKKLSGQVFSESGKRNFGSPTCFAIASTIVLGTTKGIILIFDYNQNLKLIIGPGTKAVDCGPIASLAISADHTAIASGHRNGSIFIWDTSRPTRPFLSIPHLDPSQRDRTTDGHVPDVLVTHLGFLGTRRTALVSADDRGMAFAHLATRGTGSLGRTVKTTRILGRYPDAPLPAGKTLKPSTVLALASLPLGNVDRATDTLGLTAMLTPYLLVIVSTTPIAQTQHKSSRPKEVAAHSAMSGCLAWFPAVKLKVPDPVTGSDVSKVKLVYCWSNILTVLDVEEIPAEDPNKPPTPRFRARSRWTCEEAIVAVQWLSRSVLTVLTITQRLIVLEDQSMRVTDGFDLLHKHIYHADRFSKQLHALVEQLDEEDTSMHGVVADAFYMSVKAYKSRLFLLGFDELSIGTLSNWSDRLLALMEHGDHVGAIQLAASYYTGDADKLTVGLPEDAGLRHSMVKDKVVEVMSASLRYYFSQRRQDESDEDDEALRNLTDACFVACQSIDNTDFIFDDMYEWFEEGGSEGVFLEALEPYILDGSITIVPPTVIKAMVSHYVAQGWESRLEEMICHMNTATLDLDQVTALCKEHGLYDALIYVWNQAMGDYITPLIDLLSLIVPLMDDGEFMSSGNIMNDEAIGVNAVKIFPYLSYTLTGRVYPTGEPMTEEASTIACAEIYWFLFSGNSITWPKEGGRQFLTRPSNHVEPSFPYLRLILKFDAPSFMSALNEAFEDSFLNEAPEKKANGTSYRDLPEEQIFGQTVDRQYVVSILLEIMTPADYSPFDTIYLDMFIARNLPKFPQYLLFPGSTLTRVLTGLCNYPGDDLADDAQLSAEYLLSVYQPPDLETLMPLFKKAGFYRILKRVYKVDKQYGKLVQAYFEDPDDKDAIFGCLSDCLRANIGLTPRQVQQVLEVIRANSRQLVELDAEAAATALASQDPSFHQEIVDSADATPELQYRYLKSLLEPKARDSEVEAASDRDLIERYVRLMCRFDAAHVAEYVTAVQSKNLRLDKLLPTMEETGVIDAAVMLMAHEGKVKDAMARLISHLETLESALQGLLGAVDEEPAGLQWSAEELLKAMQKYVHVGIWLCQTHTKSKQVNGVQKRQKSTGPDALSADEELWLSLIEATVQITRRLSSSITTADSRPTTPKSETVEGHIDGEKLRSLLRSLVQHTFTALLATTSAPPPSPTARLAPTATGRVAQGTNLSFLRILRAFLSKAAESSPSLADLRAVLSSIFSAYAYEQSILQLSNRLLDKSLFVSVSRSVELRQRGWRPRGSTCEACGGRVWGPGVGSRVVDAWEERRAEEEARRAERKREAVDDRGKGVDGSEGGNGKGKGKAPIELAGAEEGAEAKRDSPLDQLVLLACRHIYHRKCIDALQVGDEGVDAGGYRCPVDG